MLVTISGTGSICYGRNEAGEVFRTGGWNHVLSDEGSAYDIGLQAFKTYADWLDGRNNCPILAKKIANATGVKTLEQADVYVNDHLLDKSPVGGLAVLCAQAAEEGLFCKSRGKSFAGRFMAVGKCQCKEYIFPRANHQYGRKEASECNSKNSRKDCA